MSGGVGRGGAGVVARSSPLLWFALLAMAGHLLLILPRLAGHRFDPSTFIVAGDRFVQAGQTASPILVLPDSDGYDGQFYYRLAVAPLGFAPTDHGVTFDIPIWRMQRIFYPLLAWVGSLGNPAWAPAALLWINLAGIGAIAVLAATLSRAYGLARWVPFAIVLWPGFLTGLIHDTTEITSEALLLAALLCRSRRRPVAYAVLAGLATLTRETTLPVFAGLFLVDLHAAWRQRRLSFELVCSAAVLVPYVLWREILTLIWHADPQQSTISLNLDLPFVGIAGMLNDSLLGAHRWSPIPWRDDMIRGSVLITASALLGFGVVVARHLWQNRAALPPLAIPWLMIAALMTLFTASWIDPTGYFRAFSECWVVGCLLLGTRRFGTPMLAGSIGVLLVSWFCTLRLL